MEKILIKNSTLKDRPTNFDHMLELYKSAKEDIFSSRYQIEKEKRIRREIANSNERRRMQSINAGFNTLRNLIPTRHKEKMSKASILQQTADYIRFLEEEKNILMKRNAQLEAFLKINNLQAACNNLIINDTSPSSSPHLQQPILNFPHNSIKVNSLSMNDFPKSNQESAFKTILTAIDSTPINKIPLITNSLKMTSQLITSSHINDSYDSSFKSKPQTLSAENIILASKKRKQSINDNNLGMPTSNDLSKPNLLDITSKISNEVLGQKIKKTKLDTLSVDEGIYLSSPDHNNNVCSSGENFNYDDNGSNTILRKKFKMLGPMFRNFAPEPLPLTLSTSSIQTHTFLQPQKNQLLKTPTISIASNSNKLLQFPNASQSIIINNLNAISPTSTISTSSVTTIPLSLTSQNITFLKNFPTFINTIDGKQTIYLRKNEDISKSQIIISKMKESEEHTPSSDLHDDSLIEKLENITKNLPPHEQGNDQHTTGENYTTTSRRNLQTIVEAIKHLEGENLFIDELSSPPAIKKEAVDIASFFEDSKPLETLTEVLHDTLLGKDQTVNHIETMDS